LEGSHHLPPYSFLCDWPWGLHPNVIFSGTPKSRIPKFPKLGFLPFWRPIISCADLKKFMRFESRCQNEKNEKNHILEFVEKKFLQLFFG